MAVSVRVTLRRSKKFHKIHTAHCVYCTLCIVHKASTALLSTGQLMQPTKHNAMRQPLKPTLIAFYCTADVRTLFLCRKSSSLMAQISSVSFIFGQTDRVRFSQCIENCISNQQKSHQTEQHLEFIPQAILQAVCTQCYNHKLTKCF